LLVSCGIANKTKYVLSLCSMQRYLAFLIFFTTVAINAQLNESILQCGYAKRQNALLQYTNNYRAGNGFENYDLKYHRLEWTVSPKRFAIQGAVTSYFTFTTSTNNISFDLRNHLTVDSVKQNAIHVPFTHQNEIVDITFPKSYMLGDFDSVTVYYHGNPTQGAFRSFFIEGHSTGKILATQSEPYGASDWWPCKSNLRDKFDSLDIFIVTDTGYLAGAQGVLVEHLQLNDTQQMFHWQHRYPCNFYLVGIAISNYQSIKDSVFLHGNYLPILHYVYPQSVASALSDLMETRPLLRVFDSAFGTYPYIKEKYGHMQWNVGGGMEHATMSSMGAFNFDLVAHELAHQWFGDKVTCNNWGDIWLNEGFATYLNALAYEFLRGKPAFNIRMGDVLNQSKMNTNLSIFVEDTSNVGRIFNQDLSYQKGAMVLHTLRYMIGDSIFFEGCRNYLKDDKLAYGSASTSDLLGHFQSLTSIALTPFFNTFYYGKGYPTYLIRWTQASGKLNLEITQSTTNSATSFFPQTIPIYIKSANGTEIVPVFIGENFTKKTIAFGQKIEEITFNSNNEVLASGTVAAMDIGLEGEFIIRPNPSDGNFMVTSNKKLLKSVLIMNSLGQLVSEYLDVNGFEISIDLSNVDSQQFILKIETEDGYFMKRYTKYK